LAALKLGSKKSIVLSIPCVYLVLLLSALWGFPNSSFMPVNMGIGYVGTQATFLRSAKSAVEMGELFGQAMGAFSYAFSMENLLKVGYTMGLVSSTTTKLFIEDSALIQLACWALAIFLVGYLPARIRHRYRETIAALSFAIVVAGYWMACEISRVEFNLLILAAYAGSVALVGISDYRHVYFTQERTIIKDEKTRKFGKFGIQDMSTSFGDESLADFGGYESVKEEIKETIVWPVQQKELTVAYGIKPPKGVLLFGPPGTGKTMLMRVLSKELDMGFYYVKCSEILSQWYGESERNLSEIFAVARKNAPCVLFFDEIDSIGKKRGTYGTDDVAPRILSLMLEEMDGIRSAKEAIIVGATNVPHLLDPALLRPGRFDKVIYMPLPDEEAREEIFKVSCKGIPLAQDVDFARLAKIAVRYSGADIANVCREAARHAAREAMKTDRIVPVEMKHFVEVLEAMKPSVTLSQLQDYDTFKVDFERRGGVMRKKEDDKGVRWKDVVGLQEVQKALVEAVEVPLLHADLVKEYNVHPPTGVLLFGPPGCGKTLIVKAASHEMKVTFISVSGAELLKQGYEGAVKTIRETFNRARENSPAIIFMDEMEAIAPERGGGSSQVIETVVSQLLNEMDGVKNLPDVVVVGATNKPSMIDPALMRPGRFDKIMFIPPPDEKARKEIFELNLEEAPKDASVNLGQLARITGGFTGADIASICQEAKMVLVRRRIAGEKNVRLRMIGSNWSSTKCPFLPAGKNWRPQFSLRRKIGEPGCRIDAAADYWGWHRRCLILEQGFQSMTR
ncbi:MAG: AAA family ATPase, partial [Candidatus Micrarchaeota archaeon]|nr:AAA family ATPase [Candidatus Micrarchaeota archaeon]